MNGELLGRIESPADVKALDSAELPQLCADIRSTLVAYGKAHGGHIGSNLGVVELTVALHRVFDSPRDRIVFDVSHQSYVHKMLTGRAQAYLDPARYDEVTGFTNPEESTHDQFVLGHTGTSISLACGLAKTRDMMGGLSGGSGIGNVIAVIGDGSLSSAIAFEGLNNAAEQGGNLIVIVNDNEMSIAEDFGGMYGPLARLRESDGTAEPNIFHAFGLDYRYVGDGNDVAALVEAFEQVRDIDHPIVLHVHTRKGLGLDAEDAAAGLTEGRCEANHWQDPLSAAGKLPGARKYYGEMAMQALEARFATEPGLVVISPATPGSNGITRAFRERAGAHYVDTGIAEEHAVAFASGIAKAGGRPVLATSATFFQRTYDQLQQELALNRTPATLLVFGSGISDADNTHSGAFDIAMMANIPNLVCLAPTTGEEFLRMLAWSTSGKNHDPVVIRVPGDMILDGERKGHYPVYPGDESLEAFGLIGQRSDLSTPPAPDCPWNRYRISRLGSEVALIGLGDAYPIAEQVAVELTRDPDDPIDATVIDPRRYDALDYRTLDAIAAGHRIVATIEDGQLDGGWGEKITAYYASLPSLPRDRQTRYRATVAPQHVLNFGADKEFTDRVPVLQLRGRYDLSPWRIVERIRTAMSSR
ncbi:1-deoxy-D-xylulose-5-phosphate synthase [uncultured Bifidobacterium sp.]|uniref:1-deoxy-D-xylulose-5-phosphate synthase n=1 Tax=uncultured Bifidobacterium sp. TaxID=165187 RepID=UPI002590125B|nr:1-deoxy-D-xylulose-5-phosphate synthase [uncultured Bifidobacterium sp.]